MPLDQQAINHVAHNGPSVDDVILINDAVQKTKNILKDSRNKSSKTNDKSMRTHFELFYKLYLQTPPPDGKRFDLSLDDIKEEEVTNDLLGSYVGYLADTAKCQGGSKLIKNIKLLSYTHASIMFSSLKSFLKLRFMDNKTNIKFLTDEHCRQYTAVLRRTKINQATATDEPLFGEFATHTCGDRKAITALAYWNGLETYIEFVFLFQSCITNCGRGSEVSALIFEIVVFRNYHIA